MHAYATQSKSGTGTCKKGQEQREGKEKRRKRRKKEEGSKEKGRKKGGEKRKGGKKQNCTNHVWMHKDRRARGVACGLAFRPQRIGAARKRSWVLIELNMDSAKQRQSRSRAV